MSEPQKTTHEIPLLSHLTEKFIFGGEKLVVSQEEREKYHLLAVGPYDDEAIDISFVNKRELNPDEMAAKAFVDQEVNRFIEQQNADRQAKGKNEIEDMSKFRLDRIEEKDGKCKIYLDPNGTSYGRHIALSKEEDLHAVFDRYTESVNSDKKLSWDEFKDKFQPRPLSVLVGIVTSDAKLLLQKRNPKRVATFPNAFHLAGAGYIEPSDSEVDEQGVITNISTTEAVLNEAHEEIGLPRTSLKAISCLGVMMHDEPGLPKYPELLFLARTSMRSDQIIDESRPLGDIRRMKLNPKDADGWVKARDLFDKDGGPSKLLAAMLHIDDFYDVKGKGHEAAATFPSTRALAFLLHKLIQESVPKAYRVPQLKKN